MRIAAQDNRPEVLLDAVQSAELRRSITFGGLRQSFEALLARKCLPIGVDLTSTPRRVKFKPGRKLTVTYDVRHADGPSPRPAVAVWTRPAADYSEAAVAGSDAPPAGPRSKPFLRLAARDAADGLRLLVAPYDPTFPQLPAFFDPTRLAEVLAAAGVDAPVAYEPCIVRYRPEERHVLRLVPAQGGAPSFVVKLYPRGGADKVARKARVVAAAYRRAGSQTAVPAVWAAGDGAVISAVAPGRPLSWWLSRRPGRACRHLAAAGFALRTLHASPNATTDGVTGADPAGEVATTFRACEHIAVLLPDVGASITAVLARAAAALASVPGTANSLIHGDYKGDHVFVSSAGLALIDMDRAGPGDPALDLAKFLADLHWWLATPAARSGRLDVAEAQAAFLAGYGEVGRDLLRRARILEAVLVLRLAARRPGLHNANWDALIEALVSRAERLSEGWGRE